MTFGVSATHNGKSAIKSLLWMFLQTMDVEQHHINMLVLKHLVRDMKLLS